MVSEISSQTDHAGLIDVAGDIIFVRAFSQPMIILNSLGPVNDLLEKRSSNYSDRLETEMVAL